MLSIMMIFLVHETSYAKRTTPKSKILAAVQGLSTGLNSKKISEEEAWKKTVRLEKVLTKMNEKEKILFLQIQAKILREAGYRILSAIYSARAIMSAQNRYSRSLTFAWKNLRSISKTHQIQNFLALLANNIGVRDDLPPGWNNDWNYILALAMTKKGNLLDAVREFKKLTPDNRNYFPAAYRKAILLSQYSKNKPAIRELKNFLYEGFLDRAPLKKIENKNLKNLAALALGRIYYEEKDFKKSIYFFRQVEKDSLQYYEALFEQSWALFMNGNSNHALGSLYSMSTPFFSDKYNPESSILKAIIYFWICHYDRSRNALADFLEKHQETSKIIKRFTSNKSLNPNLAFKLFKASIDGKKVSEIPSDVLTFVIEQPSLYAARDQLAAVLEEKNKLLKDGIFGSSKNIPILNKQLNKWIKSLKLSIGKSVIKELKELSKKFNQQMKQAKFLYVELLMSETKQKLGKNLHKDKNAPKENQTYQRIIGWAEE